MSLVPNTGDNFIRFEFFRQRGTIFRFCCCKINHFRIIHLEKYLANYHYKDLKIDKKFSILHLSLFSVDPCCQNVNDCFFVLYLLFSYFNNATYKKSLSLFCILGLGWRLLIKCPVAQSKSSIHIWMYKGKYFFFILPKKNYWNNLKDSKPISPQ